MLVGEELGAGVGTKDDDGRVSHLRMKTKSKAHNNCFLHGVGEFDGFAEGRSLGDSDGLSEGISLGTSLGTKDGTAFQKVR